MEIIKRVVREPQALLGLVTLVLAGGSLFGWWSLSQDQVAWVLGILGGLILIMRTYVTPVSSPSLPLGTIVNANNSNQPTGIVVEWTEDA